MTPTRTHTALALTCSAALLMTACGSEDDSAGSDTATTATPTDTAAPESADDTAPAPTATVPSDTAPPGESSGAFPLTIDTCGTEVTLDQAPTSVVVGWPSIITTLNALGVGDDVIGYTSADFTDPPPTEAEAIAPDFRTSREVMIATGLDMFIVNDENQVDASEGNLGWSDLDGLDAGGYVLGGYCLDNPAPTGIDVVYDDIETLGAIFGVPDDAAALNAELGDRIDAAAAATEALAGSTVAVVQAFEGTLFALSGSYYAMVPTELGLVSVFADLDANFAEISPEEVLTLAPEVVIVVHEGDESEAAASLAEVSELLAAAPAITQGRIATVENGVLSGGGVNVIDVIVDVADQLGS